MTRRDLADLFLLAAIWGASFLFMRVAVPEFGPIPLIEIRVAVAALFLSAVLALRGGFGGMRGRVLPLGLVGAVNSALPFSLLAFATLSLTAGFAAVLNATAPLFGALVAYVWLRESLAPTRVLGLVLGFIGVLILVWGRLSLRGDRRAILAALLAALAYGIAVHYTKRRLTGAPPLVIATGSQIAAAVLLLFPALRYWPARPPSLPSWLCAIALGIACTGIAYVLYFRLIASAGPGQSDRGDVPGACVRHALGSVVPERGDHAQHDRRLRGDPARHRGRDRRLGCPAKHDRVERPTCPGTYILVGEAVVAQQPIPPRGHMGFSERIGRLLLHGSSSISGPGGTQPPPRCPDSTRSRASV